MVEQVFFVSTQMNKLRTQNDFVDPVTMFKSKPCQFVFPVPPQRGRGHLGYHQVAKTVPHQDHEERLMGKSFVGRTVSLLFSYAEGSWETTCKKKVKWGSKPFSLCATVFFSASVLW